MLIVASCKRSSSTGVISSTTLTWTVGNFCAKLVRQEIKRDGRDRSHHDPAPFHAGHLLDLVLGVTQFPQNGFRSQKDLAKRSQPHRSSQAIQQPGS
jgi:hypothetical protein